MKKANIVAFLLLLIFLLILSGIQYYLEQKQQQETEQMYIPLQEGTAIGFVCPDFSYQVVSYILERANKSIDIMVYTFYHEDFFEILENRAKTGVRIRVLLENNTYGTSGDEWNAKTAHYLYSLSLNYDVQVKFDSHSSYMHAKVIIVDGKIGIILSDNILPSSLPPNYRQATLSPYDTISRGWGVAVINTTIANNLTKLFDSLFANGIPFEPSTREEAEPPLNGVESYSPEFKYVIVNITHSPIRVIVSPNSSYSGILSLLQSARKSIFIEQMYVYYNADPVKSFLSVLKNASENGVNIKAIIEDDYPGNYYDARNVLPEYGVQVYPAFRKEELYFLHNKGIIVDNKTVLISSINWSEYSIERNVEVGIIIENEDLASFYLQVFLWDLSKA